MSLCLKGGATPDELRTNIIVTSELKFMDDIQGLWVELNRLLKQTLKTY